MDQRELGTIAAIRIVVGMMLRVGRPLARLTRYPVCLYYLLFFPKARKASRDYLARVLPREPTLRDIFQHFMAFATIAMDRFFLLKERYDLFNIELHGEDVLKEVLERGQGCLLLGAHIGSFEVLRALGTTNQIEVAVVMYQENARMVNRVAKAINPALAESIISLGHFDSMLKVQERLERSQWVGILGDRALTKESQTRVPFLGDTAAFSTATFQISLALKRPVIFMVGLYRGGNRYDLHFEKLLDPISVGRADRAEAIDQAVRAYVQRLEWCCKEAPYNWFNFYDFWDHSEP